MTSTPKDSDAMDERAFQCAKTMQAMALNPALFADEKFLIAWFKTILQHEAALAPKSTPLPAAVIDVEQMRRDPNKGCDCGDAECNASSRGFNSGYNQALDYIASRFPQIVGREL